MFSFPEKDDAFKTHSKQLINELQQCPRLVQNNTFNFFFLHTASVFCFLGGFLIEETHGGNMFLNPHDKINVGECIRCQ